jgi:hypothetical protein
LNLYLRNYKSSYYWNDCGYDVDDTFLSYVIQNTQKSRTEEEDFKEKIESETFLVFPSTSTLNFVSHFTSLKDFYISHDSNAKAKQ